MGGPFGVGPVGGQDRWGGLGSTPAGPGQGRQQFGKVLTDAIQRADARVADANTAAADLAAGKASNSHDVMIKLEEANLALQWTIQIRNRALEAYQEIMRMPL